MAQEVTSVREMQRNYRGLVNRVKRTKAPLYLGARSRPEVVLLDIETFESFKRHAVPRITSWGEIAQRLAWIRKGGRPGALSLSDFVHEDRAQH